MSFIIVCLPSPTVSLKHAGSTVHWHTLEGLELVWHGVGAQCMFAEWMNMWERSGSARSLWLTLCGPFSCLRPQHLCWLFSRCRLRVSSLSLWFSCGVLLRLSAGFPSSFKETLAGQNLDGLQPAPSPCGGLRVVLAALVHHLPSLGRQAGFPCSLFFHLFNLSFSTPRNT